MLTAMHNFKRWTRGPDYQDPGEIEVFFDLLGQADFDFGDGEIGARLNSNPKRAFRGLAQQLIDRMADKHDGAVSWTMKVGGTAAADAWVERWFPHWSLQTGFAMNGMEFGIGYSPYWAQLSSWFALRLDARLRTYRWTELTIRNHLEEEGLVSDRRWTGRNSLYGGVSLVTGIPWLWVGLPRGLIDAELGVGATAEGTWAPGAEASWIRGGCGLTPSVRLVLLQRAYLSLEHTYYKDALCTWSVADTYLQDPPNTQWSVNNTQFSGGLRFPL